MNLLKKLKWKIRGEVSTDELIKRGLKVGGKFSRQQGCIIDESHCWLISIGDRVTLAPRVHILAHDASTKIHLNYTKIGRVTIGDNVFIGADSIILPNVIIGNNVIIGAGSIVTKDIPENSLAIGNPARIVGKTEEYVKKNEIEMENRPVFDGSYALRNPNLSVEQKEEMIKELETGIGYVE
ncbi:acyltransferase [Brevibacterium sp. PAMC23299]|nr:acyltransferase [Brevibacterium sp. PAMC23299]